MKNNQRGSASVDMVILATIIIIFLVMPLLTLAIEKLMVAFTINRLVELMESSLYSMSEAVELGALSSSTIVYDTELLSIAFEEMFSREVGKVAEVGVIDLDYYPYEEGALPCRPDVLMAYDTLHVEIEIVYKRKFYRSVLDSISENRLNFHYDIEIPKNN